MGYVTLRTCTKTFCLALMAMSLETVPALAQSSSGSTRDELNLPEPEITPDSSVEIQVDRSVDLRPNCPFDGSNLTTNLRSVNFVTPAGGELAPELMQTLANVAVPTGSHPLSAVCDIRDDANNALRRDGWIATVQIPQQELMGTLRLDVISARISEIRITGDPGPYRDVLSRQLSLLQELDPLNERDAERILLNVNDIPGLSLRLALAPAGGVPGDVIGNLTVTYEPYAVFLNARNYNAKRIGRETLYGRFEYYGLTGLSDVSYIGAQTTLDFKEQVIVQAGHEFGIGENNIRLGANITYGLAKPDIANLDLETDTLLLGVDVTYPLARTPTMRADVSLGFDYIDQATDVGMFPLSEDSIRAFYLRGDLAQEKRRSDNSTLFTYDAFLELRQGVSWLGATKLGPFGTAQTDGVSASRPLGDSTSFIVRGGVDVLVPLGNIFGARARVEGQWTDNPLLNYDEYSIGNLSIGRGYDPGANSGDRAIGAAFELSANLYKKSDTRVQLFGFYDITGVENLDFGTPDPKRTLKSVGGGARLYLGDGVRAELTYAKPLDRALFSDTEKPPERILFSITTKFPALFR